MRMRRSKEVLRLSVLWIPRKTPQMQRPFQLEARPKRADSLVCNILPDPSDKFSKFSLTHTFPEDNHCSRYSRTLERHAPHRTNSYPPPHHIKLSILLHALVTYNIKLT